MTKMSDEEFNDKMEEFWSKSNDVGKDHMGQMVLLADVMRSFRAGTIEASAAAKVVDYSLRCFHVTRILETLLLIGKLCKENKLSPETVINMVYDETKREYERVQPLFAKHVKAVPGWSDKDLAPRHEPEVQAAINRKEGK